MVTLWQGEPLHGWKLVAASCVGDVQRADLQIPNLEKIKIKILKKLKKKNKKEKTKKKEGKNEKEKGKKEKRKDKKKTKT